MLLCGTQSYKKVIEEYTLPQEKKRARAQAEKAAKLAAKSKADDLEAYIHGQGAVYSSPGWKMQWEGEKFGGNVLLPKISKDAKMHSEVVSKLQDIADQKDASSRPGSAAASRPGSRGGSRPMTAGTHRSGSRNGSRPQSSGVTRPKTPNPEIDKVKHNHDIIQSQSRPSTASKSRPMSAARQVVPPAMPHRKKEAEKSVLAASVRSQSPPGRRGESPPDHKGAASKSPARGKGKARGSDRSPTRSQVAGGRGGKGSAAPVVGKREPRSTVDPGILKSLSDEVEQLKASEATWKARSKQKDDKIFELQKENTRLSEDLDAVNLRYKRAQEAMDQAHESNRRFGDVQKLLQQNELERIRLIDRVEQLTEENRQWRPVQRQLEGKIDQLMTEVGRMEEEVKRLAKVDDLYKLEKDKVLAKEAHCQSWMDIAQDLQTQLGRWDEVRLTMEGTERALEAEVASLEQQFNAMEADNVKLRDLLYDNHIEIPDDDEDSDGDKNHDVDSDPEEAMPRTTVKTQNLLKGQVSDVVAPTEDEREEGMQDPMLDQALPGGGVDDGDSD